MNAARRTTETRRSLPSVSPSLQSLDVLWSILLEGDASHDVWVTSDRRAGSGYFQLSSQVAYWIVQRGVSAEVLEPLADSLDIGKTQLAPLLGMDRATLRRYSHSPASDVPSRLPTHTAEMVLRFAELESIARGTFASEEGANTWLKKAHPMLDGQSPLEAAMTSYGGQRVRDMLVAIRHGGVV